MDGLFFALSTAWDIPDFKGHGLKDPNNNGAKLKTKNPRFLLTLIKSQNFHQHVPNAKLIYMDDHIPFFFAKKRIQFNDQKKSQDQKVVTLVRLYLARFI